MAGRRTNLALLVLLAGALATGPLSFALGSGWARWAVVAHGVLALGIVLLTPWKSVIARRGLRRRRAGAPASVAFAVLVVVALGTGVGHATGLLRTLGPVTAMQLHVGSALVALPFGVWHVLARRVRPPRTDLSRRTLLRSGALAAGSLAAYGAVSGLVETALPGGGRRFTGSYERGSFRPDLMPVTQWLRDSIPAIDAVAWRLEVRTGHATRTLTMADLDRIARPIRAVLDCTGGWFAEQEWTGVRVDRLLDSSRSRSILARSVTGYERRYPLADAGHLWVVTRMAGEPLSAGHGGPVRIVAPGRRGFWWVKWLERVELSDTPWWWQPPFPLT